MIFVAKPSYSPLQYENHAMVLHTGIQKWNTYALYLHLPYFQVDLSSSHLTLAYQEG